jgi:hypothetical protein
MTAREALADARETCVLWQLQGVAEATLARQLSCKPEWDAIALNVAMRLLRGEIVKLQQSLPLAKAGDGEA